MQLKLIILLKACKLIREGIGFWGLSDSIACNLSWYLSTSVYSWSNYLWEGRDQDPCKLFLVKNVVILKASRSIV